MSTWVFERLIQPSEVKTEDGGLAKIVEFGSDDAAELGGGEASGLFVRLQSWAEDKKHRDFDQMIGTRVRVTVETF